MIDVAYVHPEWSRNDPSLAYFEGSFLGRYDGLIQFRLNPLGSFCIGQSDRYEQATPEVGSRFAVLPNLSIILRGQQAPSFDEKIWLEVHTEVETENVWRLSLNKISFAIMNGEDAESARQFLASRDDQPLPERVEGFLRATERRARALIPRGMALLIECVDADLATRLAADERTAKLCLPAGERSLAVKAGAENAFRRAVRALGYGMAKV